MSRHAAPYDPARDSATPTANPRHKRREVTALTVRPRLRVVEGVGA